MLENYQPENYQPKKLPPAGNGSTHLPAPVFDIPTNESNGDDWNGLVEGARTLYRRKGTLLMMLIAGLGIAGLIGVSQHRMYESTAALEIQGYNEDFLNLHAVNPATPSTYSPESYIQTQAEILRQDALVAEAAAEVNAADWPEYQPKRSLWQKALATVGIEQSKPVQRPNIVEAVKKNLKIKSSRESRIIDVSFDASSPQRASAFANALAHLFIEQSVEYRRHAAGQIQEWLSPKLNSLKATLQKSETQLDAYARANGLMFTEGQQSLAEEKLKLLQDELSKAQADRIAKQSQYELAAANPQVARLDDAALKDFDVKIAELEGQLAEMSAILTPENYKITRLKAQIDQLVAARNKQVQRLQAQARDDFQAAQAREATLNKLDASQSSLVLGLADKVTHYNSLKHEVDANRQFYESMLQKVNEAGVAAAVRQTDIRLAGPAQPPTQPYQPNMPLNFGVGAFGSLAFGVGLVLVQERANRRVRAPGEMGLSLNVQELGAIRKFDRFDSLSRKLLRNGNGVHALERITLEQGRSHWSESFRGAVASILSARNQQGSPRVLVVTSALPREGKTTVACNLAIALAEISKRVLVVDADLRRPRVHEIFGISNDSGLSGLLENEPASVDPSVQEAIKSTVAPHLYVLPSGPCNGGIFSLLYSERTERLMDRLRQEFDYVIVDAPPCLQFADARLLSRYADGAVLVVRANHADRKTAAAAAQRLMFDGVRVLGTVLNDWDPASSGGAYGYGYSKYAANGAGRYA